ncbi:MAG: dolichyl-phosphate beta-glucosyltransferase [Candidatus Bathycorpusculaceae bacterium]
MNKTNYGNGKVDISLVFPAYNEAEKLEKAVEEALNVLKGCACSYEIIIAEDRSTDGTDKIASELSKKYPYVKHVHSDKRLGRGAALKRAFANSKGEILFFMDVDLATNIRHMETLVKSVKGGYDVAIGSRMLPESRVKRTPSRKIASKMYNLIVRLLLSSKISDHQCGFKAFNRKTFLPILEETKATHWFWDTEILIRASRKGYKIKEIPVEWKSGKDTKVHLLKDSLIMGWQALKFWWEFKRESR